MPRVPGDVGALGETMRYDLYLRHFSEWPTTKGMDSPSTRYQVGMSSGSLTFHPSNGSLGSMHIAGVLAWGPDRIPVG